MLEKNRNFLIALAQTALEAILDRLQIRKHCFTDDSAIELSVTSKTIDVSALAIEKREHFPFYI
jgi:hypothetical protein